jgi:2-methylcitrate dehydratase PrpD
VGSLLQSSTQRLAAFSAGLKYDAVPPDVVAKVKLLLLDTLGTTLAATTMGAGCPELVSVTKQLGGKPESTILGFGYKVAAANAALANGGLAHALNYDALGPQSGHVGVVCLTTPLAVAESLDGISGRNFLVAATIASEINARVTAAQSRTGKIPSDKFLAGQLFGYIPSAASAGYLLGLNPQQMESAFGLSLMQTSGTMQVVLGGDPPAKAIYGAFPNYGGVLSALLSKGGLGGECDVLEGKASIYEMFYGGDYCKEALTEDLGNAFLLMDAQFKPWPTSAIAHPFIEAGGELAKRGVDCAQIAEIKIIGHSHIRPWCEPREERQAPLNAASAANSIPFGLAKALLRGNLTLKDFTKEGIAEKATKELAAKIRHEFDDGIEGGLVRVTMKDGKLHESHIPVPLGDAAKPMRREGLLEKFRECSRYSVTPLSSTAVESLINLIDNLEDADPTDLAKITSPSGN